MLTADTLHESFVDRADWVPAIAVGDPNASPAASVSDRIDANVPTSPFSGVVSIKSVRYFISDGSLYVSTGTCTGSLISPLHVVSAAHCFDTVGGRKPFDFEAGEYPETGDGTIDVDPSNVTVFFNHDNPSSTETDSTAITVANISLHADWDGFRNMDAPGGDSVMDDVAILKLSQEAPRDAAIYPVVHSAIGSSKGIVLAGYGTVGTATDGYIEHSSDYFVKRTGQNTANFVGPDDEGGPAIEQFLFDFDGPTSATDTLSDGPTLGNAIEVTIGGGDSGGPSFTWLDADSDQNIDKGELALVGINTGVSGNAPDFGSIGAGMVVSAYDDFVEQEVTVNQPLLTAQINVSGDLKAAWIAGTDITETWIFPTATGSWDQVVSKHKSYGGSQNLTVHGLEDGTYYLASRGWWTEDGVWKSTSFTKTRVPYVVQGPSQQPQIQPQQQIGSDLRITWTDGTATTETWLFPTATGSWDQVIGKYKTYGGAKSLNIPDLDDGMYYVASRGWWVEDGVWKSTSFSAERVPYTVNSTNPTQQTDLSLQPTHSIESGATIAADKAFARLAASWLNIDKHDADLNKAVASRFRAHVPALERLVQTKQKQQLVEPVGTDARWTKHERKISIRDSLPQATSQSVDALFSKDFVRGADVIDGLFG